MFANLNYRIFLSGIAILISSCKSTKYGSPNTLIIMGDDLGSSDLGCYRGEIEIPNIDQLAMDGYSINRLIQPGG